MIRFLFLVLSLCFVADASAQGCVGSVHRVRTVSYGSTGSVFGVRSRVMYGGNWGGYGVRRGVGFAGYGSAGHSYGSAGNGVSVAMVAAPVAVAVVASPVVVAAGCPCGCGGACGGTCGCADCTCGGGVSAYAAPVAYEAEHVTYFRTRRTPIRKFLSWFAIE